MHWTTFRKNQEELRHAIVFQFSENHWEKTFFDSVE